MTDYHTTTDNDIGLLDGDDVHADGRAVMNLTSDNAIEDHDECDCDALGYEVKGVDLPCWACVRDGVKPLPEA